MKRWRTWRARRRHAAHLRWLHTRKVILPPPHHTVTRNGPEAVCCGLAAVLLAGTAHAGAFVSIDEPATAGLMAAAALAWVVSKFPARRHRDGRMTRRHPGQLCNCKSCVEQFPDC